ncbi:aspartate/glutamate racemase family protein [Pseudomonas sp. JS3066]|uniref:aspartate/glutamate racemase family protein n=1 Tax=unclassified Pseudomonas TaxID=196821 RepID=UPI0013C4977C|nr:MULTISPECIES: aspartate/glutamate racemase family protein [unclassified Pseudomonas]WVK92707.1 aspartate/glutamate racemase family protein [Pseudomonas sp. JS3066]
MRMLGVLGGMSWESTVTYYQLLNRGVRDRLGGLHSAPLLLHSVDFAQIAAQQKAGEWDAAGEVLAQAARGLEGAGATALLLATNTMHKVAAAVEQAVDIPLLHIGDAVGGALREGGVERAALLGTRFTMQEDFYRERLDRNFGIQVLVPDAEAMVEIDRVIFQELCVGQFLPVARSFYLDQLAQLKARGAQAAILGCTEIGLLLDGCASPLPLVDSAERHVAMGLEWMLGRQP